MIGQKHAEHAPPREGFREVGQKQKQKHHFVVPEAVQDVPRQPLALDPPLAVPAVRCGPRLVPPGVLVVGGPEAPKFKKLVTTPAKHPFGQPKTPAKVRQSARIIEHRTDTAHSHGTDTAHSHSTVTAQSQYANQRESSSSVPFRNVDQ